MSMACGPDAAFCVTDYCPDAAVVRLQVYEFGFDRPIGVSLFVSEVQEALVDLNVLFAFDVGGFKFVHGLVV